MLEKKITAKVNKVLKTGSLEEEQAKELKTLETLFPENKKIEEQEQRTEDEDPNSSAE